MPESTRQGTDGLTELREEVAGLRQQLAAIRQRLADDELPGIVRARGIEITDHRGTRRLVLGSVDRCETPPDEDDADGRFGIHLHDGRGHLTSWWLSGDDTADMAFIKRGNTVLQLDPRSGIARWTDDGFDRIAADDGGE